MKWVTREHVKVDRVACPWLTRKYIDPDAEFLFVPASDVQAVAQVQGATPFDTEGAKLGHRDGKCSFETIIEEYGLLKRDPVLSLLAEIVHGADVVADLDAVPESRGLKAIAEGFGLVHADDHAILAAELPVCDALPGAASARAAAGRLFADAAARRRPRPSPRPRSRPRAPAGMDGSGHRGSRRAQP